jgi:hypothetical protein
MPARCGRRRGRFKAINCGGFERSPAVAIAPNQHGFCRGSARHGQALPCACYFSRSRRHAISASNNLTRRANHRHIFIVARIKPAPENPPRAFCIRQYAVRQYTAERAEPGRRSKPNWLTAKADPADRRALGEDDGQAEPESTLPRLCASPAFKHLKPTQPSPRGRGHIRGSPEGVRKYL